MAIFKNAQSIPAELTGLLERRERVLAWSEHNGGLIAATTLGIISTDAHESKRIPWTSTLSAKWEDPLLTIALVPDMATVAWILAEPGRLPVAIRDRVTNMVVVDRLRRFNDQEVRFIAHRVDGGIEWLTIAQDLSWANSPVGQASIESELVQLRSTLGI